MAKLSVDQALLKAKSHAKKGEIAEAQKLYQAVLEAFPKNKRAQQGLAALNTPKQPAATQGPPQETINQLINLYNQGLMSAVVEQAQALKEQYPEAFIIWNILGAANKGLGRVQAASEAFKKVTELNPTYADGFSNLGTCLQEQGKLDEAIGSYKKALLLKPDYVEAHYNMGIALQDQGKLEEAIEAYSKALSLKPDYAEVYNNMGNVLKEQGKLAEATEAYNKALTLKPGYAEAYTNMGVTLKKQGKLEEAIEAYNKALSLKPDYAEVYNNMGVALQDQGKLEEAIEAYNKTLSLKPDYAEAYYNMGVTVQDQGKLEEAIASYEKALTLKPDYAEAYTNMGVALQEQGKPEEAIEAYNEALAIKPDNAEAYNNMGVTLADEGKLEEAFEVYHKSLTIKPDYAEATENSLILAVQLLPIIANYGYNFNNSETQLSSEVMLRPKYQVKKLIKTFLEANFTKAHSHNTNFNACDRKLLSRLKPKDRIFCNAYSSFIGNLLDATWDKEPAYENKVYHLGESHCLSYAHRNITIEDSNFRITPRITFGAKAFHFSRKKYDSFKAITKAHFVSLPKNSKVFLSYGEIDCRPNEGFISAATKLEKPLEELIDQTTEGYVQWFFDQNADQKHYLYFINVPAPVYNKGYSADLNSEVARTVALFNTALKKYSLQHGFEIVDVFKFTAGNEGFSNRLFHVDNIHLGAKALPEIEQQLS